MEKIITDYPNYTITIEGVVTNTISGLVRTPWLGKVGYLYVDLYHKGVSKKIALHRLLAIHFIINPDSKRTVNHLDGNKQNNKISNLAWATDSENITHAYAIGLMYKPRKLSNSEADYLFTTYILGGYTITKLAELLNTGITRLSYRMKEASIRLDMVELYKEELWRQKVSRQSKPT